MQERKRVRVCARKIKHVQEQVLCVQERASVCKESLGFANVCEGAQVRMCKER